MVLKIRLIKTSDWKGIKEIYNEWRTENTFSVPENILSDKQAKKEAKLLIKEGVNLVAEKEGLVIGLLQSNSGKLSKTKHTIYINQLNIRKNYRKKGVAIKLMKKLIDIAKTKKMKQMYLHVVSINMPAIKLYLKLGFKKTGCITKEYRFGNKYVDNNIMCKILC